VRWHLGLAGALPSHGVYSGARGSSLFQLALRECIGHVRWAAADRIGDGGESHTAATAVFGRVLCQLSYLAAARPTGFDPAISALTGRAFAS